MAARLPGGPVLAPEETEVLPFDPRPLVLVVDDELTPRSKVTRLVRALGFQAGAALVARPHSGSCRRTRAPCGWSWLTWRCPGWTVGNWPRA